MWIKKQHIQSESAPVTTNGKAGMGSSFGILHQKKKKHILISCDKNRSVGPYKLPLVPLYTTFNNMVVKSTLTYKDLDWVFFFLSSHLEADPEAARKADATEAQSDPQGRTHTETHCNKIQIQRSSTNSTFKVFYFLLLFSYSQSLATCWTHPRPAMITWLPGPTTGKLCGDLTVKLYLLFSELKCCEAPEGCVHFCMSDCVCLCASVRH